jgi:hypothetical protein
MTSSWHKCTDPKIKGEGKEMRHPTWVVIEESNVGDYWVIGSKVTTLKPTDNQIPRITVSDFFETVKD